MNADLAATISAAAAAVSTLLTLAAVLVAVGTLRAARDDSRERSRPVIVAQLQRELLSPGAINLVLRNFGMSVATDVSVRFDPPPSGIDDLPDSDMWKWLYQAYASPIATWAPGWSLTNVVRAGHDDIEAFTVVLDYSGPDGTAYRESVNLDPIPILKTTSAAPSDTEDPAKLAQQAIHVLRALVRTLR